MSIILRATAARDVGAATAAIRANHPRSAARFAGALARVIDRLERFPLSGPELGPSADGTVVFRYAVLTGFPYVVIHLPLPDGVDVLRVVDGRRDLDAIVAGLTP